MAETLNLASLRGFTVGGTVHIIVNNLIGFTTVPTDLHSSRYASDVAKCLPIPIFHVNGEDPDAGVRVARLAVEYRYAFGRLMHSLNGCDENSKRSRSTPRP